jgi:L-ascorbate metabolism protein UlaG (beta-lactamase superfamily)
MIPGEATGQTKFPKHFDGTRFFNPDARQAPSFLDALRWKLTTRPEPSPSFIPDVEPSVPPLRVEGSALRITLVNHSTVLLQHRGWNILTDPIWSERTSPLSWIGPRRRRAPGVLWKDLPPIDVVLLSHNHYDHLDLPTLRLLAARGGARFIVPAGVDMLLRSENIGPVHCMDWGQALSLPGPLPSFTLHSVPALHFSSRSLRDRNKTLWCGYMLEFSERLVYFAGDTGFGTHFAQIREAFGAPHVSLLPIGAYEPRWFMSPVHMGPDEAVRTHQILGSRISIAIHHGTFQLADEGLDTPKKQLLDSAPQDSFLVLNNGQSADTPWR